MLAVGSATLLWTGILPLDFITVTSDVIVCKEALQRIYTHYGRGVLVKMENYANQTKHIYKCMGFK